jgi:hypothetical protein
MKYHRRRSPGFGHLMSKSWKQCCCMEFPLSSILTMQLGLWRWLHLLWIFASTSNQNIGLTCGTWKLRFDLSDISVLSTFGVSIIFLIFSRWLIKHGLRLSSSWVSPFLYSHKLWHFYLWLSQSVIVEHGFSCLQDWLHLLGVFDYVMHAPLPPMFKWSLNFKWFSSITDCNCRQNTLQSQVLWEKELCHLQYAQFPNSLDDDMTRSARILILFSNTKISKISSQSQTSNVYHILLCWLFWRSGFRAEQTNDAESTSTHSATHLLGLSNIVSILFLIAISVSLTSLNMWPPILFALTEELACYSAISMLEAGWLISSIIPLLVESSWWSSAALVFKLCISSKSCDLTLEFVVGYGPKMLADPFPDGTDIQSLLWTSSELLFCLAVISSSAITLYMSKANGSVSHRTNLWLITS